MKTSLRKWAPFLFLFAFGMTTAAWTQDPGTVSDPLVSKSYIDQFFRFRSIVLPGGNKLNLNAGAMLVLRSGRLKLTCPKGKALVDLTDGKEIGPNSMLPTNHLILVPDSGNYSVEGQAICLLLVMGVHSDK